MDVIRYETLLNNLKAPIIFLAGPTVRGHQQHLLPSWRTDAIKIFQNRGFKGTLIIPEFSDPTISDKGRYDLPIWEYNGMKIANCIMFWVPRTRELIGLTTNFEFGYWMRWRDKLVYGRPPRAYRIDYLDILWQKDYQEFHIGTSEIFSTLEQTVDKSIETVTMIHYDKKG